MLMKEVKFRRRRKKNIGRQQWQSGRMNKNITMILYIHICTISSQPALRGKHAKKKKRKKRSRVERIRIWLAESENRWFYYSHYHLADRQEFIFTFEAKFGSDIYA